MCVFIFCILIKYSLYQRRSHSHSEKDRRRPGRGRRVLKSASELLSNDMVFCGLTVSKDRNSRADCNNVNNDDDDNDDSAEVFLGVNDARLAIEFNHILSLALDE